MKKYIYHIFAALSALLLLASCRQEEEIVVQKPTLKVLSSDVVFDVKGGQGSIVVEADQAVSVTSERPWVQTSVSGNTITVTVSEQNPNHASRYSRLTIQSGSEKTYVTVHQYGVIFDGLEMEDEHVSEAGSVLLYKYLSNVDVTMSSDVDWIHFELVENEEDGKLVKVIVDPNPGLTRYAHVSYTAGPNTGSAEIMQFPTPTLVSGWDVSITDGAYVFPNQVDQVTVTPPDASTLYDFALISKDKIKDESEIGEDALVTAIFTMLAIELRIELGTISSAAEVLQSGVLVEEHENLPSSIWAVVTVFNERGVPTGEYYYKDLQVPDRGPVKQLVDGWDITHTDASYEHPNQTDVFTITPKAGYEDVKYIATVVKKSAVAEVEDFAFTNFALTTREEILAKVASGALPSFEAGLLSGTSTISGKNMVGDVYVVVVAFDDNQFYTGDYGFAEFAVEDKMPLYYRWPGKWKITGREVPYSGVTWTQPEEWTITLDEDGLEKTLTVRGINNITASSVVQNDAAVFKFTYNEDGTISLLSQLGPTFLYNSSYGNSNMMPQGLYTKNGTSFSRVSAQGYTIFKATMSDDYSSASITPGIRTSSGVDYEYVAFRVYLLAGNGSTYSLGASSGVIPLPFEMTRIE